MNCSVPLKGLAGAIALALGVSGCGGGGAADPFAAAPAPPALVVRPGQVEAYSGNPITISVLSGVGPFAVFSSNPVVVPVTNAVSGTSITVTPTAVSSVTPVTLTVRDALGREQSVTLNVNPGSVLAPITITPLVGSQCGTASAGAPTPVCSGDTANISTIVRNAGVTPVPGRLVRFEVVQGAFAFLLPNGTTATSVTTTTDATGQATAVLRAVAGAASQVALVRAVDTVTNNRVETAFTIVQQIDGRPVLSVVPSGYAAQGFFTGECGGTAGDFLIYGGTPPYTAQSTLPNLVRLSYRGVTSEAVTVPVSGDRFTASTSFSSSCVGYKATIVVLDATGRKVEVTYEEKAGTNARPTPPAPDALVIVPGSVTLAAAGNCGGRSLQFRAAGGTPPYVSFSSSEPALLSPASVAGNPVTFTTSTAFTPGNSVTVSVLDSAGKIASATVSCQ
ncbi:MAG: hypothetical protein NZ533_08835 [Casimicrobiaceae bacterium]|nr:hypothetical protein [Casimicrobiaceae bacterium]MDW8311896.1 hypothetical protein [Burkholderiales bacterium]